MKSSRCSYYAKESDRFKTSYKGISLVIVLSYYLGKPLHYHSSLSSFNFTIIILFNGIYPFASHNVLAQWSWY